MISEVCFQYYLEVTEKLTQTSKKKVFTAAAKGKQKQALVFTIYRGVTSPVMVYIAHIEMDIELINILNQDLLSKIQQLHQDAPFCIQLGYDGGLLVLTNYLFCRLDH